MIEGNHIWKLISFYYPTPPHPKQHILVSHGFPNSKCVCVCVCVCVCMCTWGRWEAVSQVT